MTLPALSYTTVSGSVAPLMSTAFVKSTMPMIGLVTGYSVDGPNGSEPVGAVLKSVDAAKACAIAVSMARTTCGTMTVPLTEVGYAVAAVARAVSMMFFVISKYWPPLLVSIARGAARSALGGAIATT